MDSLISEKKSSTAHFDQTATTDVCLPRPLEWALLIIVLVISDTINIGLALRMAYTIRFELTLPIFDPLGNASVDYYQNLVLVVIPAWLVTFVLMGLYNPKHLLGGTREYSQLFAANTLALVIVVAAGFFEPDFIFARGWILIAWLSAFFFTALGRFVMRRFVYFLRGYGFFLSRALIVGYNDEAATMAEQLMVVKNSGVAIVGFVDDDLPVNQPVMRNLLNLGNIAALPAVIRSHHIEEVILTSSALTRDQILQIFEDYGVSQGIKMHLSSGLYEIITTGLQVREFAWVPLVEVNKVRLTGTDRILKTLLDYGMTIPAVILLSPLFLILALLVRLDSPGPVLHRRRVLGVNGREFDAFKFRTMLVNGDEILAQYPDKLAELQANHKLKDDPRITRLGAFLRKTSLDELPQLFNVLRNEMSLVGPRMISPAEISEYTKWGINLLTVKPGITGKWQVSGRSDVTYQERVRLDMYYIRNWNIWLDVQLLLQTIPAVLLRRGAY